MVMNLSPTFEDSFTTLVPHIICSVKYCGVLNQHRTLTYLYSCVISLGKTDSIITHNLKSSSLCLFVIGEGDAFGNLHLTGGIHKSAVMLRCSCCVDINILDTNDLKEVLQMFPQFHKNLKKKISTVMQKTVLTSQVRV